MTPKRLREPTSGWLVEQSTYEELAFSLDRNGSLATTEHRAADLRPPHCTHRSHVESSAQLNLPEAYSDLSPSAAQTDCQASEPNGKRAKQALETDEAEGEQKWSEHEEALRVAHEPR
jgi:hypothetical protein